MQRHQVEGPWHAFVRRPGSARPKDCLLVDRDFRLDEKIAERWMNRVGGRRREHDLRVAREIDALDHAGAIDNARSTQLDVVLGRHGNLGMDVELVIAPAELRPPFGKDGFVVIRRLPGRLVGSRPELSRHRVAEITERPPVVTGNVLPPSRDREILPPAAAAAGIGYHDVIPAVGQEIDLRHRSRRAGE